MSKKVNSIVSGGGLFLGIMTDLCSAIRDAGGTDEDIYRLATPDGRLTMREMAKLVVREPIVREPTVVGYLVMVDNDQTLEQMIAAGRYGWKMPNINAKHFPLTGTGKVAVNLELIHFNRAIDTNDVLKEIDARGYRPATIAELLALGASQPELQRQFMIIALGSVYRDMFGNGEVVSLDGCISSRGLNLSALPGVWGRLCRFAIVRKSR